MLDRALISADANCCALGWPGLKGHSVNYLFEEFLPDLRKAGVGEEVFEQLLVHNPAKFLTMQEPQDIKLLQKRNSARISLI